MPPSVQRLGQQISNGSAASCATPRRQTVVSPVEFIIMTAPVIRGGLSWGGGGVVLGGGGVVLGGGGCLGGGRGLSWGGGLSGHRNRRCLVAAAAAVGAISGLQCARTRVWHMAV